MPIAQDTTALTVWQETCAEDSPRVAGAHCTRPWRHAGDHISRRYDGTNKKEIDRWPQKTTAE